MPDKCRKPVFQHPAQTPGFNTENQKQPLAEAITRDVMDILGYGADSVSVAFRRYRLTDGKDEVHLPDVQARSNVLYKKPGYSM